MTFFCEEILGFYVPRWLTFPERDDSDKMLRIFGNRRSVRRSVRKVPGGRSLVRQVRVRKGEMTTTPPSKPSKHLLPCHVRLLDGTDLYIQLPVRSSSFTDVMALVLTICMSSFVLSCLSAIIFCACHVCPSHIMHKTNHVHHDRHVHLKVVT